MTRQHISSDTSNILRTATLVVAVCTTLGLLGTVLQTWALFSGEYSPWGAIDAITVGALPLLGVLGTQLL